MNLLVALLCLVWGSTWLAIKIGLRDVPPFTGAALRFFIAGLCMVALVPLLAHREGGSRPPFMAVLLQGLFQFALNYALVYVGETVIPSGLVSVLWSVFPLFIALAGHFILKTEILAGRQWLGMAVAFAGVALLFVTDLARVDVRAVPMGLLVLLAPLGVSISTLFIKQRAAHSSSLILNRDSILLGFAVLAGLAVVFERDKPMHFSSVAIGSVLYLALFGTVFTFGVYLWLLRYEPAYRMSLTAFVTPVVALLVGALFGGEPLRAHTLAGTACVLGGVALVLGRRAPPPNRATSAPE